MKTLLEKARKKQKQKKIPGDLYLSDKNNKKLMLIHENKQIHFGQKGSKTYLEGATKNKRKLYRSRHEKILLKNGKPAYKKFLSPAYLSYHILW